MAKIKKSEAIIKITLLEENGKTAQSKEAKEIFVNALEEEKKTEKNSKIIFLSRHDKKVFSE